MDAAGLIGKAVPEVLSTIFINVSDSKTQVIFRSCHGLLIDSTMNASVYNNNGNNNNDNDNDHNTDNDINSNKDNNNKRSVSAKQSFDVSLLNKLK